MQLGALRRGPSKPQPSPLPHRTASLPLQAAAAPTAARPLFGPWTPRSPCLFGGLSGRPDGGSVWEEPGPSLHRVCASIPRACGRAVQTRRTGLHGRHGAVQHGRVVAAGMPTAETRGTEESKSLPSPSPGSSPCSSCHPAPWPVPQQLPTTPLQHGDTRPPGATADVALSSQLQDRITPGLPKRTSS